MSQKPLFGVVSCVLETLALEWLNVKENPRKKNVICQILRNYFSELVLCELFLMINVDDNIPEQRRWKKVINNGYSFTYPLIQSQILNDH